MTGQQDPQAYQSVQQYFKPALFMLKQFNYINSWSQASSDWDLFQSGLEIQQSVGKQADRLQDYEAFDDAPGENHQMPCQLQVDWVEVQLCA